MSDDLVGPGLQTFARTPPLHPLPELADLTRRGLIKRTDYTQESPARSVSTTDRAGQCKSIADQRKLLYIF